MRDICLWCACFLLAFANVQAQDVFEACRKGDLAQLEKLYALKPDTINSRNENSFTPLIIAVYRNQYEATGWLLKKGADVNAGSPEGPAIVAAGYKGNLQMIQVLAHHKANLNSINGEGITALMYAAMGRHTEVVKLLIKLGADKTLKSQYGKTALDYAKMYEFTELIKLLE